MRRGRGPTLFCLVLSSPPKHVTLTQTFAWPSTQPAPLAVLPARIPCGESLCHLPLAGRRVGGTRTPLCSVFFAPPATPAWITRWQRGGGSGTSLQTFRSKACGFLPPIHPLRFGQFLFQCTSGMSKRIALGLHWGGGTQLVLQEGARLPAPGNRPGRVGFTQDPGGSSLKMPTLDHSNAPLFLSL